MIGTALCVLLTALIGLHLVSALLTARRYLRPLPPGKPDAALPFVSLIRPVCGVDAFDRETLGSSFGQDYPAYEILFCAASDDDPAVALVRDLIAAHPGGRRGFSSATTRSAPTPSSTIWSRATAQAPPSGWR